MSNTREKKAQPEKLEVRKEFCPICKSEDIIYDDFFGIQCNNCKQLVVPVQQSKESL